MFRFMLSASLLFAAAGAPAMAASDGSDGNAATSFAIPDYFHVPGPDMASGLAEAPQGAANDYLFIAGSAFVPRTSSQTVTYPGSGCTYTDGAVTTDLSLPDGAVVEGVRLYYYDSATAGDVTLFFTRYDGGGGSVDILTGSSTTETGYASEYFDLVTPETINTVANSYVLTANMNPNLRFCGMRVFYDSP